MLWKPRGVLDENTVNQVVAFIGSWEELGNAPFDRFSDLTELALVDLNFNYVFHVALYRRMTYAGHPAIKSAFLVKSRESIHYSKLHAMLTDHSPLCVRLFTEREAAAKWLGVSVKLLTWPSSDASERTDHSG